VQPAWVEREYAKLAEMAVVRPLQLVFDQNPAIRPDVLAQDVSAKGPDRSFLGLQFQIDAKRLR
jgi:hypothetical protein